MEYFRYTPLFITQVTYFFFALMVQLKNYLLKLYRNIISSIAFYPTIILLGFFSLAILVLTLDHDNKITKYLLDKVPFLIINNADTARLILSTFIAGLLSLTVFSFSMVMLILSQASSNFSPRLLPGLIANRKHQIVLGSYLGTIIYSVLILISILPNGDAYTLPGFAILLGIFFGISCLGVFVYFIHSISQEIQINNILKGIFERTKQRLLDIPIKTDKEDTNLPNTQQWAKVYSVESGYYQGINQNLLTSLATEFNTILEIITIKGVFILKGIPILKSQKQLSKEEEEKILSCLQYSSDPMDNGSYMNGIQQIAEITVKAMSPGINDPGTAINAIDYLSELLAIRVQLIDKEYYKDKEETLRVIQQTVSLEDLFYEVLASLRQYCKHDVLITKKLLLMLEYLLGLSSKEDLCKILHTQIDILVEDANLFIKNKQDLQLINQLVSNIQNNLTQVKRKSNSNQS